MRWCSSCGRAIEDHEVLGTQPRLNTRGPVPGHNDRVYRCAVVRTGTVAGTDKPIWTPKGAVRD